MGFNIAFYFTAATKRGKEYYKKEQYSGLHQTEIFHTIHHDS